MSNPLARRLIASLAFSTVPAIAVAQNMLTVRADSTWRMIAPSSRLAVPVILDMSAAGGTNLASLTAGVSFGTSRLTFDSVRTAGFGSLTPNTTSAASGTLTLGVMDATGTTTTQTLATMYFTASATTGGTTIAFSPTVAGSDLGVDILSLVRTQALDVCVAPAAKWGDVNGDSVSMPAGDGSVNIIDAQQIARYSVGLPVANRPGIVARGDVTNDGNVNIIDGQQIARFSVGLASAVRVNTSIFSPPPVASVAVTPGTPQSLTAGRTLQLIADPRDASAGSLVGCQPLTWASNSPAVATVSTTGLVTAVAAGTAAITATSNGQTGTATITVLPLTFAALTAGNAHSCGLTSAGEAYCWGANGGQLGDGTATNRLTPVAVQGGFVFTTLKAGVDHTCGLTKTGAAYCWGGNGDGQLGDGTATTRLTPVAVQGGLTFTVLSVGAYHNCGLTSAGAAYCWGRNAEGELGDGSTTSRSTPKAVENGLVFTALMAGGNSHTCGLTSAGAAYCWGLNGYGQLGDGTWTQRLTPAAVQDGFVFTNLTAGTGYHTCGLTSAGAAYCWGYNETGQVGDGTTARYNSPMAVLGGLAYTVLTAGYTDTCGLTSAGATYCWGQNNYGQIGDGTLADRLAPVAVQGGISFATVTTGTAHTCGLTSAGAAYCWGGNGSGQLGDGTTTQRLTPTAVALP